MRLEESAQMYLETIFVLQQKNGYVRSIDVAEHMGYSKPSVSRAVNNLKSGGFLTMEKNGELRLTPTGIENAKKIFERHSIITEFLTSLGVAPDTASLDACKMEHDISDESFDAIKNFLRKK